MPDLHTLYHLHSQACALTGSIYNAMVGTGDDVAIELNDSLQFASKSGQALYALIEAHPANLLKKDGE